MADLLYHYCATPTAFAILSSRTFRLSPLSSANDSLEGRVVGKVFDDLLPTTGLSQGVADVASVIVGGYPDATEGFALCLSEHGDLLSQWRAYSADATGFAIGFDPEKLAVDHGPVNFGSKFYELVKVSYGTDGVAKLLAPVIDSLRAEFSAHGEFIRLAYGLNRESAKRKFQDRNGDHKGIFVGAGEAPGELLGRLLKSLAPIHFQVYGTKPSSFEEEREWRLLRYRHRIHHPEIEYFADHSSIRPYIPCLVADPAVDAIVRVILGPKNRSDIGWVRAFLESVGLGRVSVSHSSIDSYR